MHATCQNEARTERKREREGGGYRTISWRLASVQVLCPQENAQSFVASTSKNENRKIKRRKQKIKNKTERPNKAEKLVKLALGNYALIFVAPLPTLPLSRSHSLTPSTLPLSVLTPFQWYVPPARLFLWARANFILHANRAVFASCRFAVEF